MKTKSLNKKTRGLSLFVYRIKGQRKRYSKANLKDIYLLTSTQIKWLRCINPHISAIHLCRNLIQMKDWSGRFMSPICPIKSLKKISESCFRLVEILSKLKCFKAVLMSSLRPKRPNCSRSIRIVSTSMDFQSRFKCLQMRFRNGTVHRMRKMSMTMNCF